LHYDLCKAQITCLFGKLIDKCSFVRNFTALEVEKAGSVKFLFWSIAAFRLVYNELGKIAWTQFFKLCHWKFLSHVLNTVQVASISNIINKVL